MGTSADLPIRALFSHLDDIDLSQRIPVGAGKTLIIHSRPQEAAVNSNVLDMYVANVCSGKSVELPKELLSDAKYLAWIRDPKDLRIAVLTAAIACEAKIKKDLVENAKSEKEQLLVDVILKNPRDVTVAVAQLFDRPAQAILGRSMKTDRKTLFDATRRLFETRNAIAHGKAKPTDGAMLEAVRTATEIFGWLEHARSGKEPA